MWHATIAKELVVASSCSERKQLRCFPNRATIRRGNIIQPDFHFLIGRYTNDTSEYDHTSFSVESRAVELALLFSVILGLSFFSVFCVFSAGTFSCTKSAGLAERGTFSSSVSPSKPFRSSACCTDFTVVWTAVVGAFVLSNCSYSVIVPQHNITVNLYEKKKVYSNNELFFNRGLSGGTGSPKRWLKLMLHPKNFQFLIYSIHELLGSNPELSLRGQVLDSPVSNQSGTNIWYWGEHIIENDIIQWICVWGLKLFSLNSMAY